MVSQEYCFIPSEIAYTLLCYGLVSLVSLLIAVIEILNRYGAGNKASWILIGKPQTFFYATNIAAGSLTLFISETTGATNIIASAPQDLDNSIYKCLQVGLASMFILRSRLISVEKKDKSSKIDLGPAQILNMIYRYLDRLTDQSRGTSALEEVEAIMSGFKGSLVDLTALCLKIPESIPPADIEKLRRDLNVIQKNQKELTQGAQALVMGLELQREVGTETLASAVAALTRSNSDARTTGEPQPSADSSGSATSQASDVVRLNAMLDETARRIAGEQNDGHRE